MNASQAVALAKRYRLFLILLAALGILSLFRPALGQLSAKLAFENLIELLLVVPPIFLLLGLLDVWVPRELMIRLTGEGSGLLGIALSFLLGSFAAGPLYGAFPVAAVMLKKGSKLSNVMIFVGAWSTTKIPLLLFEATSMGWPFMLGRFLLNLPIILIIGYLVQKSLPDRDLQAIYDQASHS
jgi:uncharacterized membrane protein YraQ (UPF0718 family)